MEDGAMRAVPRILCRAIGRAQGVCAHEAHASHFGLGRVVAQDFVRDEPVEEYYSDGRNLALGAK